MIIFGIAITGGNKPQIRDLYSDIVPVWNTKWRELGVAIGIPSHELETISINHAYHPRRCEECCRVVLSRWLEIDTTASRKKIDEAINSISSNTVYPGSIKNSKYLLISSEFSCHG